jgi:hypothetical protein
MRDANGDMSFGSGQQDFLLNSPAAVAQIISTRLALWLGEFFLDVTDGTNWKTGVLGRGTAGLRDDILRQRITETPGVLGIVSGTWSSNYDATTRRWSVACDVDTIYGKASVSESR